MRMRFRRRRSSKSAPWIPQPGEGELEAPYWQAHLEEIGAAGLVRMTRELPTLVGQAVRLAWQASRADTTAAIALNLTAGIFTAYGLLATTGVLTALFSAGPTPDRVRAALPSLLLVAGAAAIRSALLAGAGWAQSRLQPKVNQIVETRLFDLTTRVDLAAFDNTEFQDAMHRARDRGTYEAPQMVQTTIDILTGLTGLVAAAGVLGVLHPVLLPLLLAAALPDGWAAVRSARMRYLTMYALATSRRRKWILADLMAERRPAAEVRSFTMRSFLLGEYDRLAAYQRDVELNLARRQTWTRVIGDAMGGIATGGVYATLGVLLAVAAVPLAVAGAAVLAIRSGQSSLANLLYAINRCYESGLYFADYLGFCDDARQRIPSSGAHPAPETFDRITVDNITFAYPGEDKLALREVSIHIDAGEVVALVGENGSGKTTLAKILAGLYLPAKGEVRWDGIPLREIDLERLHDRIAVIPQEYTHWPMTARHNIAMGRPIDESALDAAAAAAGADQVIADLPAGYSTFLDRRFKDGHELSGGQWQRITAARGFYRDAPLLICDEPTAALDARAEHALFERIRTHADGRTVLLISHRLASVRHADRIYVFDRGRVIEQGTHADLMALDGLYAELFTLQASAYHGNDSVEGWLS